MEQVYTLLAHTMNIGHLVGTLPGLKRWPAQMLQFVQFRQAILQNSAFLVLAMLTVRPLEVVNSFQLAFSHQEHNFSVSVEDFEMGFFQLHF